MEERISISLSLVMMADVGSDPLCLDQLTDGGGDPSTIHRRLNERPSFKTTDVGEIFADGRTRC